MVLWHARLRKMLVQQLHGSSRCPLLTLLWFALATFLLSGTNFSFLPFGLQSVTATATAADAADSPSAAVFSQILPRKCIDTPLVGLRFALALPGCSTIARRSLPGFLASAQQWLVSAHASALTKSQGEQALFPGPIWARADAAGAPHSLAAGGVTAPAALPPASCGLSQDSTFAQWQCFELPEPCPQGSALLRAALHAASSAERASASHAALPPPLLTADEQPLQANSYFVHLTLLTSLTASDLCGGIHNLNSTSTAHQAELAQYVFRLVTRLRHSLRHTLSGADAHNVDVSTHILAAAADDLGRCLRDAGPRWPVLLGVSVVAAGKPPSPEPQSHPRRAVATAAVSTALAPAGVSRRSSAAPSTFATVPAAIAAACILTLVAAAALLAAASGSGVSSACSRARHAGSLHRDFERARARSVAALRASERAARLSEAGLLSTPYASLDLLQCVLLPVPAPLPPRRSKGVSLTPAAAAAGGGAGPAAARGRFGGPAVWTAADEAEAVADAAARQITLPLPQLAARPASKHGASKANADSKLSDEASAASASDEAEADDEDDELAHADAPPEVRLALQRAKGLAPLVLAALRHAQQVTLSLPANSPSSPSSSNDSQSPTRQANAPAAAGFGAGAGAAGAARPRSVSVLRPGGSLASNAAASGGSNASSTGDADAGRLFSFLRDPSPASAFAAQLAALPDAAVTVAIRSVLDTVTSLLLFPAAVHSAIASHPCHGLAAAVAAGGTVASSDDELYGSSSSSSSAGASALAASAARSGSDASDSDVAAVATAGDDAAAAAPASRLSTIAGRSRQAVTSLTHTSSRISVALPVAPPLSRGAAVAAAASMLEMAVDGLLEACCGESPGAGNEDLSQSQQSSFRSGDGTESRLVAAWAVHAAAGANAGASALADVIHGDGTVGAAARSISSLPGHLRAALTGHHDGAGSAHVSPGSHDAAATASTMRQTMRALAVAILEAAARAAAVTILEHLSAFDAQTALLAVHALDLSEAAAAIAAASAAGNSSRPASVSIAVQPGEQKPNAKTEAQALARQSVSIPSVLRRLTLRTTSTSKSNVVRDGGNSLLLLAPDSGSSLSDFDLVSLLAAADVAIVRHSPALQRRWLGPCGRAVRPGGLALMGAPLPVTPLDIAEFESCIASRLGLSSADAALAALRRMRAGSGRAALRLGASADGAVGDDASTTAGLSSELPFARANPMSPSVSKGGKAAPLSTVGAGGSSRADGGAGDSSSSDARPTVHSNPMARPGVKSLKGGASSSGSASSSSSGLAVSSVGASGRGRSGSNGNSGEAFAASKGLRLLIRRMQAAATASGAGVATPGTHVSGTIAMAMAAAAGGPAAAALGMAVRYGLELSPTAAPTSHGANGQPQQRTASSRAPRPGSLFGPVPLALRPLLDGALEVPMPLLSTGPTHSGGSVGANSAGTAAGSAVGSAAGSTGATALSRSAAAAAAAAGSVRSSAALSGRSGGQARVVSIRLDAPVDGAGASDRSIEPVALAAAAAVGASKGGISALPTAAGATKDASSSPSAAASSEATAPGLAPLLDAAADASTAKSSAEEARAAASAAPAGDSAPVQPSVASMQSATGTVVKPSGVSAPQQATAVAPAAASVSPPASLPAAVAPLAAATPGASASTASSYNTASATSTSSSSSTSTSTSTSVAPVAAAAAIPSVPAAAVAPSAPAPAVASAPAPAGSALSASVAELVANAAAGPGATVPGTASATAASALDAAAVGSATTSALSSAISHAAAGPAAVIEGKVAATAAAPAAATAPPFTARASAAAGSPAAGAPLAGERPSPIATGSGSAATAGGTSRGSVTAAAASGGGSSDAGSSSGDSRQRSNFLPAASRRASSLRTTSGRTSGGGSQLATTAAAAVASAAPPTQEAAPAAGAASSSASPLTSVPAAASPASTAAPTSSAMAAQAAPVAAAAAATAVNPLAAAMKRGSSRRLQSDAMAALVAADPFAPGPGLGLALGDRALPVGSGASWCPAPSKPAVSSAPQAVAVVEAALAGAAAHPLSRATAQPAAR